MAFCLGTTMASYTVTNFNTPSASLAFFAGSRTRISVKPKALTSSATLLHCAFTPSSSLSLSSASSFAGTSLGLDLKSNVGTTANKRRSLVVSAKKYQLCQTKRHRSRKSLARTHGFRLRMRTTSGRAVIKRRREKGRWQLCTKTNPSSGKRA